MFEEVGVDARQVRRNRENLFDYSGHFILRMLARPNSLHDYVLLARFFPRYWRYKALWKGLTKAFIFHCQRFLRLALSMAARTLRHGGKEWSPYG